MIFSRPRLLSIGFYALCATLFVRSVSAQVVLVSPLANGIAQVHGSLAHMRVRLELGPNTRALRVAVLPDTESIAPWKYQTITERRIFDSLYLIPRESQGYSLYWIADSAGVELRGSVSGVVPGHVIGIAGQSNAQGYCWEMNAPAVGDIRMLGGDRVWLPAKEPTGGQAGGPWILMANRLYAELGDNLPIAIVNAAVGSTGLLFDIGAGIWIRNPDAPDDSSTVYGLALQRFRNAGWELEYFCWIQGETDGCCNHVVDERQYRNAYAQLITDLQGDLGSTFPALHLQISGNSLQSAMTSAYARVRDAQRVLPRSTLVGTAIGRSLTMTDGLHYTVPTVIAVSRMFADAMLSLGRSSNVGMYPPLQPDTNIVIDSPDDGQIPGRYCIAVTWKRGGIATPVHTVHRMQSFALANEQATYDTSQVTYRIDPKDPSRVQIWLRYQAIDPHLHWWVTYVPTAGASEAPVAAINGSDTIFATAFYQLPANPWNMSGAPFGLQLSDRIRTMRHRIFYEASSAAETGELKLYNEMGQLVGMKGFSAAEDGTEIDIADQTLPPAVYFVQLRAGIGFFTTKVVVF